MVEEGNRLEVLCIEEQDLEDIIEGQSEEALEE